MHDIATDVRRYFYSVTQGDMAKTFEEIIGGGGV
jgi:hypothetical protein